MLQNLAPIWESAANRPELEGKAKLCKMDADDTNNRQIASDYGVSQVGGREGWRKGWDVGVGQSGCRDAGMHSQ